MVLFVSVVIEVPCERSGVLVRTALWNKRVIETPTRYA